MFRIFITSTLIALAPGLAAQQPSVEEIVARANTAAYYAGADGSAQVNMVIEDGKGGQRERQFTILRLNLEKGNQKFYVYFKAPADVRKMAFLVWKNEGKDDDRWFWLPALNLSRRIAPGDKRTSFVGSDFVYEDVSGRGIHADNHRLVEATDTQYVIDNTPKEPDTVEFSSYRVWIDRDSFLPRRAEYTDKKGKLYRIVEATKVENINGYPTVTASVVSDLNTGGKTTNTFSDIRYDIGLKENIFTERFLRRPPREVTKR